jgi:hypothetical protein
MSFGWLHRDRIGHEGATVNERSVTQRSQYPATFAGLPEGPGRSLPYNSMPRFWGGVGSGEHCAACEALITKEQLVIEGVASMHTDKKPTQFHVKCFYVWDAERRAIAPPGYSIFAADIAPSTSKP